MKASSRVRNPKLHQFWFLTARVGSGLITAMTGVVGLSTLMPGCSEGYMWPYHNRPHTWFVPADLDGDGDLDVVGDGAWLRVDAAEPYHELVFQSWMPELSYTINVLRPSVQNPAGLALVLDAASRELPAGDPSKHLFLVSGDIRRDFTVTPFEDIAVRKVIVAEAPALQLVAVGSFWSTEESEFFGRMAVADFDLSPTFDWTALSWRMLAPPPEMPDLFDRMTREKIFRVPTYDFVEGLPFVRLYYQGQAGTVLFDVAEGKSQRISMTLPRISDWKSGMGLPLACEEAEGRIRDDCIIVVRGTENSGRERSGPVLVDRLEPSNTGEWTATESTLRLAMPQPSVLSAATAKYVRLRTGQGRELLLMPPATEENQEAEEFRMFVIETRGPLAVSAEVVLPNVGVLEGQNNGQIDGVIWYDLNGDGLDDAIVILTKDLSLVKYINQGDGTFIPVSM